MQTFRIMHRTPLPGPLGFAAWLVQELFVAQELKKFN